MSRQSIPYDGYPAPGAASIRNDWRGDHFGPNNSYQANGYTLYAKDLGMAGIELCQFSAFSQSGNYYARAFFPPNSGNNEPRAIPPPSITVKWYSANGTEATNNNTALGAECVQLFASGI